MVKYAFSTVYRLLACNDRVVHETIFRSSLHALSWRALAIKSLPRDMAIIYDMQVFPPTCPWLTSPVCPGMAGTLVVFSFAIAILYTALSFTRLGLGLTCVLSFDPCATDDARRPPCTRDPIRCREQRTSLATAGNSGIVQLRTRQDRPEYGRRCTQYHNRLNLSVCSIKCFTRESENIPEVLVAVFWFQWSSLRFLASLLGVIPKVVN